MEMVKMKFQLLLKDGTNMSSNAVLIGASGLKTALSSLETRNCLRWISPHTFLTF